MSEPGPDKGGADSATAPPWHSRLLPFSAWAPLLAGTLAGIALRLVFSGEPGGPYAAMMSSFIYLSPAIVGAVTVYVAERRTRRSWAYYFAAPFVANCLYVLGTLLIMIEGLICAIVIVPLFALLGAVGGLIMGAVCRLTNWPKQTLLSVGFLPLVFGSLETNLPLPERIGTVERALVVRAPPAEIWRQILHADDIDPQEIERAWLFRIGAPIVKTGVTAQTPEGPVRRVSMERNVYFDEVITDWEEERYLRWTYRYYADSFPRYALDDHVVLGGHYFDIQDTSYTLTPGPDGTEVRIELGYRVSTQFNWYAEPVARFLLGNLAEVHLEYYRNRSESSQARDGASR